MSRGKFIVFEGPNGCGKGTQIDFFSNFLRNSGKAVPIFLTGEPNNFDENGRKARELLSADGDPYKNSVEAVGYFALNRISHNKIFNPLLEQGISVISDRYYHSNFAFQHAQGIDYSVIAEANSSVVVPDLTFIFDVPADVAFERLAKRDGKDRRKFDSTLDFIKKARDNYLELQYVLPKLMGDENIVVVDGTKKIEAVSRNITEIYLARFPQK